MEYMDYMKEMESLTTAEFSDNKPRAQGSHRERFDAYSAEGTHCQPVLACCFMKCLLPKSIKC